MPLRADDPAWSLLFDGSGSAEGAFELLWEQAALEELPEAERLGIALRVLLSGAYAREESPWIDRARFLDRRELPRPHRLRRSARALPFLLEAAERHGADAVFPEGFVDALEEVDPATSRWLREFLAGGDPPPRFESDEDWYCSGQGRDRRALSKETMSPAPERRVLKFGVPWHERARHEARQADPGRE